MRKTLIITGLLLILTAGTSNAQKIKGAILAGTNLTQVDGDEVYGFKRTGWNFGLAAMVPLGDNFYFTLENNFNQKGAYQKKQGEWLVGDSLVRTGEYDLRLTYVEIPAMIQYNDKDIITAGLGMAYSRLVDTEEIEHSGLAEPYSKEKAFNKDDILGFVDVQFRVYQRFYFNFRYSYSFKPIRERYYDTQYDTSDETWTRKQYNNALSFRLMYRFNENPDKQGKPNSKANQNF